MRAEGRGSNAYLARLLAAFEVPGSVRMGVKPSQTTHPGEVLVEPLTERELEVLRLIATGCSNKEIAHQLVLAIGTVKRHTANIFNKLAVRNRTEAVARARELDLV